MNTCSIIIYYSDFDRYLKVFLCVSSSGEHGVYTQSKAPMFPRWRVVFWNTMAWNWPGKGDDKCVIERWKHTDFLTTVWQDEQRPDQSFPKSWIWHRGMECKIKSSETLLKSPGREKRVKMHIFNNKEGWMSYLMLEELEELSELYRWFRTMCMSMCIL